MDDRGIDQKARNQLVLSFLSVRRAIGALGFFLPLALIAFAILWPEPLGSSISAYFHSPMRDIFVGTLIAQAVFLWSYEGFAPEGAERITDRGTARVASVGAMLIALAPTTGPANSGDACTLLACRMPEWLTYGVHFAAAGVFFGALAVFCLVLFVKGAEDSAEKRASNRIYRICGWTILACLALILLVGLPGLSGALAPLRPVFWLETIATFAFATSWAVKGDSLRPLVQGFAAMQRGPA
ncbi:DUF998 domain-containing protein [Paracoccus nototheniae]